MKFTVCVICFKTKVLKDGKSPLMLRICKNGKRKYKSLGIAINPVHWNFKENCLKESCPDYERMTTYHKRGSQQSPTDCIREKNCRRRLHCDNIDGKQETVIPKNNCWGKLSLLYSRVENRKSRKKVTKKVIVVTLFCDLFCYSIICQYPPKVGEPIRLIRLSCFNFKIHFCIVFELFPVNSIS